MRKITAARLLADLDTHHIEGIAREGNTPFTCPLITPITNMLWQGGCTNRVNLQGYFKHIISLYPWERYNPGGELDSFVEVRLYDGPRVPDEAQLYQLAQWINICKGHGRTLVHCQAGLNRSGLLAGLSLVLDGVPARDAIDHMREKRSPAVLCNKAFETWLLAQGTRWPRIPEGDK
jgi:protein-tyrosine phosphatase